jgi:hypothetical protein
VVVVEDRCLEHSWEVEQMAEEHNLGLQFYLEVVAHAKVLAAHANAEVVEDGRGQDIEEQHV